MKSFEVFAALGTVNVFIALAGDFLASRHDCSIIRVIVFPTLFTGTWLVIFGYLFGFGDGIVYSNNVLAGFPDIVQGATWLGGRPAIDFVLTLFATVAQELGRTAISSDKNSPVFNNNDNNDDAEEQQQEENRVLRPKSLLVHPATYYAILVTALAIFGGALINIHPGSFFQIAYPDYVPETVPVGCVIGPGGIKWQRQFDYDRWLNRTRTLADVMYMYFSLRVCVCVCVPAVVVQVRKEEKEKELDSTHNIYIYIYSLVQNWSHGQKKQQQHKVMKMRKD